MEQNRRAEDRSSVRPEHIRDLGITNRIYFTAPGERIKLRDGTEELVQDRITRATWADVMRVLAEREVVQPLGVSYLKLKADFGVAEGGRVSQPDFMLSDFMREDRSEQLRALDLEDEAGQKAFILRILQEQERESRFGHGMPDQSAALDVIADKIVEYFKGDVGYVKVEPDHVFRDLCAIIEYLLPDPRSAENKVMLGQWAAAVRQELIDARS